MEDHQPRKRFFASGAGLIVRGWARRATNLLITKKGYKQVMKKISNETKGCRDVCLAMKKSARYSNKGGYRMVTH